MSATNRGSEWNRWDPHLHGPGTLHEDQFGGDWDRYLTAIESATPPVRAFGVTDYLVLRTYKRVREWMSKGRLQDVRFVFPNIELRLDIATHRDRPVNVHLLFSPHAPNHEEQIERILASLKFRYQDSTYSCTESDLVRLGRSIDPTQSDHRGALKVGAGQFKINATQVQNLFNAEAQWMRENCLVAIAGSGVDGIAGIKDSGFRALHQEIGRLAHVVFSGSPRDREFWLGKKAGIDRNRIVESYGTIKPCLHGSDAHGFDRLLAPEKQRLCWVLSDLSFDGLRQVVMEPARRVFIGADAPTGSTRSETIERVKVKNAAWLETNEVRLNSGLVAIIGARGSGKTALADIVAKGADAVGPDLGEASFIGRAGDLLGSACVDLFWGDETAQTRGLDPNHADDASVPRVRYLSQRFVEKLCSSDGLATALLKEIETVIFNATQETERLGTARFEDLRELRVATTRQRRSHLTNDIFDLSSKWAADEVLHLALSKKTQTLKRIRDRLDTIAQELRKLGAKGDEKHAEELASLQDACATVSSKIQALEAALKRLEQLEVDVVRAMDRSSETLAAWKTEYAATGIPEEGWEQFRLGYRGDPNAVIHTRRRKLEAEVKRLRKGPPPESAKGSRSSLDTWPLEALEAKRVEVEKLVGLDKSRSHQHQRLQRELGTKKQAEEQLVQEITYAEGARTRQKDLLSRRRDAYARVFQTFADEQEILERLYEPLRTRLRGLGDDLSGLEFFVRRRIDLEHWVAEGERLFDLRKATDLRHGKLKSIAREILFDAWETGDANTVGAAMSTFINRHAREIVSAQLRTRGETEIEWYGRMAAWLFSTSHVRLEYGVRYAGTEIERLSPGMRGIVLLILYLAVDEWDTRPLVVDQPEDNLDPRSVFSELVRYFRKARTRRQIILVTHNANLVVNADADQVIVAKATPDVAGTLPRITYEAGGLDEKRIRDQVCALLEGGEDAFKERERRYRLSASG